MCSVFWPLCSKVNLARSCFDHLRIRIDFTWQMNAQRQISRRSNIIQTLKGSKSWCDNSRVWIAYSVRGELRWSCNEMKLEWTKMLYLANSASGIISLWSSPIRRNFYMQQQCFEAKNIPLRGCPESESQTYLLNSKEIVCSNFQFFKNRDNNGYHLSAVFTSSRAWKYLFRCVQTH